jgi:hypothetical protein
MCLDIVNNSPTCMLVNTKSKIDEICSKAITKVNNGKDD